MALDSRTRDTISVQIADFNERVKTIRADPTLSELGKAQAIREAHGSTTSAVEKARGQAEASTYTRRKDLERRLFGLDRGADASTVIAYRDAQDRVASVKSAEELADLMERASSIGDSTLLKAAFAVAHTRSRDMASGERFENLVNAYVQENPGDADALAEYQQMTTSAGLTEAFGEKIALSVPMPAEVRLAPFQQAVLSDEAPTWRPGFESTPALPPGLPLADPNPGQ